jgi:hypothetical protein
MVIERGLKKMLQHVAHMISWIDPSPVGLLFPTSSHTSIQLGKKVIDDNSIT